MWLLKIEDAADGAPSIKLEYHVGTHPNYAILSHRWGPPSDEVSFQDLQNNPTAVRTKAGYRKVEQCCIKALERGLRYAWIDTCCIDKSSSAELSEAINSMYAWYRDAQICFAYLEDVSVPYSDPEFGQQLKQSAWFTRGWTLQELLAPSGVTFFTGDWHHKPIGSKASLASLLHKITSIPVLFLVDRNFISQASVAEKLSWASKRVTTRVEDEAYCLMGLFGVHIPIIYGEGRHAFQRLQEEIMKITPDHSIFAWSSLSTTSFGDYLPVLAERPAQFLESSDHMPMDLSAFDTRYGPGEPGYTLTNFGLRIDLPICSLPDGFGGLFIAFLACKLGRGMDDEVVLILRQRPDRPDGHFIRVAFNKRPLSLSSRNAAAASRMKLRRGILWISTHIEGTLRAPLELSSRPLDSVQFRGISFSGETSPFMHSTVELVPGNHVAIVAAFQARSGCHQDQMHVLFAAMGLHNGAVWYYFDGQVTAGHELVTAEELYSKLDLFGHNKSWYYPEVRDKVRFIQRDDHVEWNSGPCNCFNVHINHVLNYKGALFQVDGDASVQWVELKIPGRAVSRHSFDRNRDYKLLPAGKTGTFVENYWPRVCVITIETEVAEGDRERRFDISTDMGETSLLWDIELSEAE
ncbi:hypothetical protein N8I77_009211 [Diaporthe amygdali]|uniref:Heterokaryon incompatibility domain-containing protein n=1 Tax=Phomopsis amygdali TaxID=1214568 RepID=A0AAD9S9P5_PHOAM|nr:hypothetical protein N8I77_009211 [Diaporthe amygdali]